MHSVGIAVIDFRQELCGKLGKKGTASDYAIYNRKSDESVLCFYEPSLYPDKLVSLLHCLNSADLAVLVFDGLSRELGEAIVALDALGTRGIVVYRGGTKEELAPLVRGTAVEKFEGCGEDDSEILLKIGALSPKRDAGEHLRIPIDSAFMVKSVGLVALGVVKSGEVKVHDALTVYPSGKKAVVRSLQVQDKDVQSSGAGDRVGLCLKGVDVEDLERGVELAKEGELLSGKEIAVDIEISRFQKAGLPEGGSIFLSSGMQFASGKCMGTVEPGGSGRAILSFAKPIAYKKGDHAILADTNRPLRILGRARF